MALLATILGLIALAIGLFFLLSAALVYRVNESCLPFNVLPHLSCRWSPKPALGLFSLLDFSRTPGTELRFGGSDVTQQQVWLFLAFKFPSLESGARGNVKLPHGFINALC